MYLLYIKKYIKKYNFGGRQEGVKNVQKCFFKKDHRGNRVIVRLYVSRAIQKAERKNTNEEGFNFTVTGYLILIYRVLLRIPVLVQKWIVKEIQEVKIQLFTVFS